MGYDISEEQFQRLQRFEREGRRCAMSTGRGGCFNRATWKEQHLSWTYKIGEGPSHTSEMTFCGQHHSPDGYEGTNFRVLSSTKITGKADA